MFYSVISVNVLDSGGILCVVFGVLYSVSFVSVNGSVMLLFILFLLDSVKCIRL